LLEKKLKVESFNVTNIVANADIGMKIDIGQLAQSKLALKDETFPGVIYRMGTPVKAVLVFSSGKIVFTGARTKTTLTWHLRCSRKTLWYLRVRSKHDHCL
jgi:transcription initiation factor TFIID TATA-box-binding protein